MNLRVAPCAAAGALTAAAQTPDLYDETVLRTLDLTFAQSNWYQLLQQNYGTGVEVLADLTVDGVLYPTVGVHFRGTSSYTFIGSSQKKPFGISLDAVLPEQRLQGYKSLNLNNAYLDPTFVREVLCYRVFRGRTSWCCASTGRTRASTSTCSRSTRTCCATGSSTRTARHVQEHEVAGQQHGALPEGKAGAGRDSPYAGRAPCAARCRTGGEPLHQPVPGP